MSLKANLVSIASFFVITIVAIAIGLSLSLISGLSIKFLVGASVFLALLINNLFFSLLRSASRIENIKSEERFMQIERKNVAFQGSSVFAQAAFDSLNSPIFIVDVAGRVIMANNTAKMRFSLNPQGGRLDATVRTPEILGGINQVIKTLKIYSFILEQDINNKKYEKVDITPLQFEDKLYVMVNIIDETNARLAEKMRVDFLANAGHELRTPLASIRGFLETLQGPAKDDVKARERFLKIMSQQAERMSRLINDILSLSRIELNEHLVPKDSINLREVIELMTNATLPIIESYESRLDFEYKGDTKNIKGDADQVQQVLTNLVENALKYGTFGSPIKIQVFQGISLDEVAKIGSRSIKGSSYIQILTPPRRNLQKYSAIRIENEGKGIKRQYMIRLSERFYRIDDESALIKGTGLGLAIVKHILSRHEGGLIVESKPDFKTAFTVYFPN